MRRRSHVVLAALAVIVLAIGLGIRRALARADEPTPAAPPSEAAALQQLGGADAARTIADSVAGVVARAAAAVAYDSALDRSIVRWTGDTLAPTDARPRWLVVVARAADGTVSSTATLAGGRVRTQCGAIEVEEVVLGTALSDAFVGAGVFDLEGRLVGVVRRCPLRLVAAPGAP